MGALAGRTDQAPRAQEDADARMLHRSLYAIPQGRRALGQASPYVGGTLLRGRRIRLRSALGSQMGLPGSLRLAMGRDAEEVRMDARRLCLHSAVYPASARRQ